MELNNTVYINTNYINEEEVPFQFAHEISHALNGDKGSNSFCSNVFYIREECAANKRAVGILLEYCELNNLAYSDSVDFMLAFGIPLKVGYVVDEVFKERFGVQYSESYCEM
ncbi:ImmA/IrrE family metallo-endopeptidase [Pediococcus pentosaceus]|nr:ImmA/IrrE family metallo-endopeptidase [Pediococcus pentosaceus]